jgi:hypothetical protein
MATLADGIDFVVDDVLSFQEMNRIKDHWRSGSPPANPVAGMIYSDSDDDSLYHRTAAAWQKIVQEVSGVVTIGSSTVLGQINVYDGVGKYFGIKAQAMAANNVYTWPAAFPASDMVLQSTNAGVLSWVAAGGGGAPVNAQYVVLAADATLTVERVLAVTSPLIKTDAGAGNAITLSLAGLAAIGAANYLIGVNAAGAAWEAKQVAGTADRLTVTHAAALITMNVPDAAKLNIAEIAGTTEVVVNQSGADLDFRVEGDTIANLLQTDAGNDEVIFGAFAGFAVEYANGNSGANKTIDWGKSNKQSLVMTAACALTFTAPGQKGNLLLKCTTVNNYALTFPAEVKWPAGTKPTQSTGAADVDIYSFYYDGTNYYGQGALDFS